MDQSSNNQSDDKNGRVRNHSLVFWFLSVVGLLGIDQLSKWLVFRYNATLSFNNSFGLIPFKNDQFAFSLPVPLALTYAIYAIVFIVIAWYLKKYRGRLHYWEQFGWLLIIVGGLSNVIERLLIGYVRDIIQVPFGGIINLADIYIILGILLLLVKELELSRRK